VWGGWLSKKPFQKELAMHWLTFDPGQRRVLLLVSAKTQKYIGSLSQFYETFYSRKSQFFVISYSVCPGKPFQPRLLFVGNAKRIP
jgi:hypothetical protein